MAYLPLYAVVVAVADRKAMISQYLFERRFSSRLKRLGGYSVWGFQVPWFKLIGVRLSGIEHLPDEIVRKISALRHLQAIDIREVNIMDNDISELVSKCCDLEILYLENTSITEDCLRYLVDIPKLRFLTISSNCISESQLRRLSHTLPNCRIVYWQAGVASSWKGGRTCPVVLE